MPLTPLATSMEIKHIVVILLIGLFFGFIFKMPNIDSNISGYNGLMIGESTLKDIESTYGMNYKISTKTINIKYRNKESESITVHKIDYPKKGICFVIFSHDLNKGTINEIIFSAPFDGHTEKDICINKNTFKDVIEKYGSGDWNSGNIFCDTKLSLSYDKITFRTNKVLFDSEIENIDSNIVYNLRINEIVISSK